MRRPKNHTTNTRIPSANYHKFAEVPHLDIPRSTFDRSHGYKTTFDSGYLIPILADEVLPGDSFNCKLTAFARLSTPINPIMDNMYMDTHFFSVPVRLVWDNWQEFMGETEPTDPVTTPPSAYAHNVPTMISPSPDGYDTGSLSDYLTIPTKVAGLSHSSLWHRAYNLIWNQWFRDENLQSSVTVNKGNSADTDDPADYVIKRRGKRHDYFTSALPWPQKGPASSLSMSGNAAVIGLGTDGATNTTSIAVTETDSVSTTYADAWDLASSGKIFMKAADGTNTPAVYADLSNTAAVTINELRLAFATQRFLEIQARGGSRYIEVIKSHFSVSSPDGRLQRAEYLGGGSSPVNISPVAQTTSTDASGNTTPQGNLAAIGTTVLSNHGFTKSFTEHCLILGLVSVRADLTYQQGLNRMFSRETIYDFYWPSLSNIGEQTVLNKEIYADGSANDDLAFGYQERFSEYRYKNSSITGKFRSNATGTLDSWHLSQDFGSLPALGNTFIEDNPPVDRVVAVDTEPQFIFDSLFKMKCTRPMPIRSAPGGLHF
jgi:hypothetical protein